MAQLACATRAERAQWSGMSKDKMRCFSWKGRLLYVTKGGSHTGITHKVAKMRLHVQSCTRSQRCVYMSMFTGREARVCALHDHFMVYLLPCTRLTYLSHFTGTLLSAQKVTHVHTSSTCTIDTAQSHRNLQSGKEVHRWRYPAR